ncbi:MAG: DUF4112 domain-containing protein [Marinicaulis sp.]|nr:DUF4112 domain-containing protein [Marinicaulis sp.]NNE41908.1 DUF4112 domain-containing protein [Marinicaulis sp.]NNL90446.1 DUF4112 domain-containing protein [Marinicaulis sp.]
MNRFDRRDPTFRADDEFRIENDPLLDEDLPHAAARARVEQLSNFLDNKFRLPVLGYRFGWDSIIGLIPGAGDIITALMSLYLMAEAARAGAGAGMLIRMGLNVLIDTVVGAVPLLGDIFDFAFRSNYRNANIMRAYFEKLEKSRDNP